MVQNPIPVFVATLQGTSPSARHSWESSLTNHLPPCQGRQEERQSTLAQIPLRQRSSSFLVHRTGSTSLKLRRRQTTLVWQDTRPSKGRPITAQLLAHEYTQQMITALILE